MQLRGGRSRRVRSAETMPVEDEVKTTRKPRLLVITGRRGSPPGRDDALLSWARGRFGARGGRAMGIGTSMGISGRRRARPVAPLEPLQARRASRSPRSASNCASSSAEDKPRGEHHRGPEVTGEVRAKSINRRGSPAGRASAGGRPGRRASRPLTPAGLVGRGGIGTSLSPYLCGGDTWPSGRRRRDNWTRESPAPVFFEPHPLGEEARMRAR